LDWLPAAMLDLNSRKNAATTISPFLYEHGWDPTVIQVPDSAAVEARKIFEHAARDFVLRLRRVTEFIQTAIAAGTLGCTQPLLGHLGDP
jgi:hypothetical protein